MPAKSRKVGNGTRTKLLQVWLTEAEKAAFKAAADACGLNVSAWIRERAIAAATKEGSR